MVPLWKQSRRSFFMLGADRVQRGADPKWKHGNKRGCGHKYPNM